MYDHSGTLPLGNHSIAESVNTFARENSEHFLPPVNSGKKVNLELSFETQSYMRYFLVLISI